MSTGIFVQVRLRSTRLPSKALIPLPGGCLIQHVMRCLAAVPADVRALLTDGHSLPALRPLAEAEGFQVFAGPDEDVLGRYCMASRLYRIERVIRATGDNPLASARLARDIIREHEEAHADLSHFVGVPWGSGIEVVTAEALYAAERDATRQDEREHITTFHYRHPGRFRILEAPAPPYAAYAEGRVTVDTAEDMEAMRRLFEDLYLGTPIEIDRIIAWLKNHPPACASAVKGTGNGGS
ncbi:MAG: cytidylyltransferase domain-containing protein [Spirochaetia bacterium]